jgi:hypothetical protein
MINFTQETSKFFRKLYENHNENFSNFEKSEHDLLTYNKKFRNVTKSLIQNINNIFIYSGIPIDYNKISYFETYNFTKSSNALISYYCIFKHFVINNAIHLKQMKDELELDISISDRERDYQLVYLKDYNIFSAWLGTLKNSTKFNQNGVGFSFLNLFGEDGISEFEEMIERLKSALEFIKYIIFRPDSSTPYIYDILNSEDQSNKDLHLLYMTMGLLVSLETLRQMFNNRLEYTNLLSFTNKSFVTECNDILSNEEYIKYHNSFLSDILELSFANWQNYCGFIRIYCSVLNINLNMLLPETGTGQLVIKNTHYYPHRTFLPKDYQTTVPTIVHDLSYILSLDGFIILLIKDSDAIDYNFEFGKEFKEYKFVSNYMKSHYTKKLLIEVSNIILKFLNIFENLSSYLKNDNNLENIEKELTSIGCQYESIVEKFMKSQLIILDKEEIEKRLIIGKLYIFEDLKIMKNLLDLFRYMKINIQAHEFSEDYNIHQFMFFSEFEENPRTTVQIYMKLKEVQDRLVNGYNEANNVEKIQCSIRNKDISK